LLSVARGTSSNQLPVHCYSPLFFRSSEPDCADATTFPVASETGQNNWKNIMFKWIPWVTSKFNSVEVNKGLFWLPQGPYYRSVHPYMRPGMPPLSMPGRKEDAGDYCQVPPKLSPPQLRREAIILHLVLFTL